MPDCFIVTVMNEEGTFEIDLQIPAKKKVSELALKLLEILKILDEQRFGGWSGLKISFNGRPLYGVETFACIGIFDGSKVVVSQS